MQVSVTILLAAMIDNEGGEYTLPATCYDNLVGTKDRAIGLELLDEGKTIRLYLTEQDYENDIIIPHQN